MKDEQKSWMPMDALAEIVFKNERAADSISMLLHNEALRFTAFRIVSLMFGEEIKRNESGTE